MDERQPEPWLRGALDGVHPFVAPVFFSYAQVREDLAHHTAGLTHQQLWHAFGRASVGFHLKHLAGSVDRITTYLMGQPLTNDQLLTLRQEHEPDADVTGLLDNVDSSLRSSEERLRTLDPASLYDAREVGRQRLPTTVVGLVVHLAEHTQRHLGQAITLAQLVRDR